MKFLVLIFFIVALLSCSSMAAPGHHMKLQHIGKEPRSCEKKFYTYIKTNCFQQDCQEKFTLAMANLACRDRHSAQWIIETCCGED